MAGDLNDTDWNSTEPPTGGRDDWPMWKRQLADVYPYLPTSILVCVMLAMGCSVKLRDVWNHYKRPVGMAIGGVSQFILLPLLSFGLAHAFRLPPAQALGFLITACCPGGTTSNIYAYYVDGDLPLSICMTVTATVLALGMMPLNLFIYSRSWTSDSIRIPYERIAITLASILVPVIVGMLIHWKFEKVSRFITKIGAVMGMLLIVVITTVQAILYPYVFTSWWQVWVISVIFPYLGFAIGYGFAFICRRNDVHRRTIAIETGIQNMGVAFTVVALSYKGDFAAEANVIPILTGMFVTIGGISCVIAFRLYLYIQTKCSGGGATEEDGASEFTEEVEKHEAKSISADIAESDIKQTKPSHVNGHVYGQNNIAYEPTV